MGASINVCLLIYCLLIVRLEMSVLSMSVRQLVKVLSEPVAHPVVNLKIEFRDF